MAYKPLSQTVVDDEIFANPSSEAVFELTKLKADVDLGNLSLSGVEGQVLTLGASGPYWEDAASGGGGSAEYPPQGGNAGKFLQTDGSDVSWQSVTGFEPEVSLTENRVVISNASGKLAVSSVTPTTLEYLDVSSSVTGLLSQKANVALSNLSGTTAINQTLLFESDDTYDIGASADFRPANVYVTQSVQVPRIHPVDGVGSAFHDLTIRGGDGITGNHDGGDVTVRGGNKNGSGADGEIILQTAGTTRLKIGATGNIQASGITASRALVTDESSNITASSITATQLGYLSSASGDIQTQINGKEPTLTKGNLTESTSSVLTISGGTGAVIGSGTSIQVKEASTTVSGFLSSTNFTTFNNKQNAITGGATSITTSNLTASRALVSDASGKVAVSSVTSTELSYVSGVTSAIQTQFSGKQNTITGAATTITASDLTASRALIANSSGKVAVSSVTDTELSYVSGVTSAIQTQINGKQATITGAATTITTSDLTASRAVISNASGKVDVSATTSTELGYLSGTTSAVQTQLNARLPITTATASTTNATVTTLQTIATSSDTTNGLEVKVVARRTGGTAGAAGDAAFYVLKAMAKNISGTVTLSTVEAVEFEDQSSWDADLVASGTNVLVRITGATNNNISWSATTINVTV